MSLASAVHAAPVAPPVLQWRSQRPGLRCSGPGGYAARPSSPLPLPWRRLQRPPPLRAAAADARNGQAVDEANAPIQAWDNQALATVLSISCLNLMSFTAVAPIAPDLMRHFSLGSDASIGVMSSSFALGRFLTTTIWPIASDFFGRKRVLCVALAGGTACSALQGAAIALHWPFLAFLVVRSMAGMFSGIVPVVKAYIVDRFPREDVPRVLAYREAAGTLAFVIGPGVGGVLASQMFAAPLFFSAASGAVATALTAVGLEEGSSLGVTKPVGRRRSGGDEQGQGGAGSSVVWQAGPIITLSFVWSCTRTCFHAYFPLLLSRRYALSVTSMGMVLTALSLLVAAIQVSGFELCRRRIGLSRTLYLGGLLVSGGLIAVAATPTATMLGVFLAITAIYSTGVALMTAAVPAALVRTVPPELVGRLLGVESAVVNFGRIVAPPLFGLLKLKGAFRLVGFAMAVATALVWLIRDKQRQQGA